MDPNCRNTHWYKNFTQNSSSSQKHSYIRNFKATETNKEGRKTAAKAARAAKATEEEAARATEEEGRRTGSKRGEEGSKRGEEG